MNIGLFTDTFFPQINGVATSVHILYKELVALGHNVYIFTTTDPRAIKEPHIFRMPSMPFMFMPTHRVALMYPPKMLLKIRKLRLDVVHTHSEFPMGIFGKVVAEFFRLPLVHTYHTMWEDYVHYIAGGHLFTPKFARQFSKFFCHRARVIVAPTEKAMDYLIKYGVERPIKVIPTGIDFEPFNPNSYSQKEVLGLKESLGLNPKDPVLLFVGRLGKEKSADVILNQMPNILNHIPNAKMLIVGEGPVRPALQELAKQLGISDKVIFTGAVPWSQVGKYYQLGDVFLNASVTETQGLTYAEAMASHLPVIAKRDKSIEGLLRHKETGYTFNQPDEIAQYALEALTDKAQRQRVIQGGLVAISHLSSKKFGLDIERLYAQVTSAYPRPKRRFKTVRLKIKR